MTPGLRSAVWSIFIPLKYTGLMNPYQWNLIQKDSDCNGAYIKISVALKNAGHYFQPSRWIHYNHK